MIPRMTSALLVVAACLLAAPSSAAQESGIIELRDGTTNIEVLPFAKTAFEHVPGDAPQRLGFRPDTSRFKTVEPSRLRGSIDAKAAWICFTLRSVASSRSWLLSAGPVGIEDVTVYIVDPDGSVESRATDTAIGSNEGRHYLSEYTFRLTIGSGQVKTVYMRFASEGILRIRASLWDSFAYIKADEFDSGLAGFLLGVLVAVFIYTLLIAIYLRERANGYYLVYLLGFALMIAASSGAGGIVARLGLEWVAKRAITFSTAAMALSMTLYAKSALSMDRRSPFFSGFLFAVACLVSLYIVGLSVLNLRTAMVVGNYLDLLSRVAVLAAAAHAVRGGGRRERYFLVAIALATVGFALSRVSSFGLFAPEFETTWGKGEVVGALAQILLLSYGITDSINMMRREKEEEQRRSIELLGRANKVKEDFVIGMSLEFRSPLYGIVGLIEAMEDLATKRAGAAPGIVSDAAFMLEASRLSSLVKAETHRLLGKVANIAVYVRLRNDDLVLVAERVSLREILDGAEDSASHFATGKNIAVEKSVDDVEIGTDGRILDRIVYNLLADAFKRSPSGIVTIQGGKAGDRVVVDVADSAPSLTEEVLSRLRSHGTLNGLEDVGPGLELLVARLLAERLGGSLEYSWFDGRGRFKLEIPRECSWQQVGQTAKHDGLWTLLGKKAHRLPLSVQPDLAETASTKPSRGLVLVYDEDPVFLEALKRHLEGRGYAIVPILSADKAVELVSRRSFDLVLLDASGQGRVGLEVCARIRAVKSMEELPVVVMTDRESAEAVEAAFRAGASDCLPKLSPNELLFSRVDTQVSLRRSVEETLETRRKVAELERLKTLGILSAGVAHEVNTPTNAIIRNLPLISEVWRELSPVLLKLMEESKGFSVRGWTGTDLMREVPELLSDTYNAGLQIKKIVEDLKEYTRDTSLSPPEPVDISVVAGYATRLLRPLVDRSTRRFVLDIPPGLPSVIANFQKLTQVAVIVLENALQSLPGIESGVTLRTRFDSGRSCVILECEDQGSGIQASHLDKIFVPFFTTKQDDGGTGLGLPVALGIVRDAGGEIEIESELGRGTTVRVVFPAKSGKGKGGDD